MNEASLKNRLPDPAKTICARYPGLCFAAAYAALTLALLNPTLHGRDGLGNYVSLRSIVFDGDLSYENDYALFDEATGGRFEFSTIPVEEATQRPGNRYGIGSSLLWSPFVLCVRAADWIRGAEANGLEARYAWAVGVGSAFWAGLGLWILFCFCRSLWGGSAGWVAVAAALALSPMAFYAFFHTSMSHAAAFFAMTGFLAAWASARRTGKIGQYVLAGAMAGLAALIRIQDAAVVASIFALEVAFVVSGQWTGTDSDFRKRIKGIALGVLAGAIVFAPQMTVWRVLYGSYFSGPAPYLRNYSDFHLLRPVHAIECLFSTNHGLFLWHPLLAVGLAGLAWAGKKQWQTATGLALAFLATWHLVSCWQVWFAGASFGNRLFLSILPVFAAGWAVIGARLQSRKAKTLLWAVILAGGIWNAGLAVQYGTGIIPRQGEIPMSTLIGNQFTKAPKLVLSRLKQAIARNPDLAPEQFGFDDD